MFQLCNILSIWVARKINSQKTLKKSIGCLCGLWGGIVAADTSWESPLCWRRISADCQRWCPDIFTPQLPPLASHGWWWWLLQPHLQYLLLGEGVYECCLKNNIFASSTWVYQGVCCSNGDVFYDPLHGLYHEGGECHGSAILSFGIAFLGDGDNCGMFSQ